MKKKKKCVHVIKFSYTLPVEVKISKTNVCILLLRVCDVCVYIYMNSSLSARPTLLQRRM